MGLASRLLRLAGAPEPRVLALQLARSRFRGELDTDGLTVRWLDEPDPYGRFEAPATLCVSRPWWDEHDDAARERLMLHELLHLAVYQHYGKDLWDAQHRDEGGHSALFEAMRTRYGLLDVPLDPNDLA